MVSKFSFWVKSVHQDSPPYPSSTTSNHSPYTYVSEHIDEDRKCWKLHIINDMFDHGTAQACVFHCTTRTSWHGTSQRMVVLLRNHLIMLYTIWSTIMGKHLTHQHIITYGERYGVFAQFLEWNYLYENVQRTFLHQKKYWAEEFHKKR